MTEGNGTVAIALREDSAAGLAMSFAQMRARVKALDEFFKGVMQEGTDYGIIPGTPKPSLYQPGAQLLDGIFGLAPAFDELPTCVRDFDRGFFSFDVRCKLISRSSGETVAEAVGHCNSKEDRYRWRKAERVCPSCGADAITRSKFDGGWFCFAKKGGCGAKFEAGDPAIEAQESGRVENPDPYTLVNTIHKMAQKRAHVAATLNATGASRIFTQDVEDMQPLDDARAAPPAVVTSPDPAVVQRARDLFSTLKAEGFEPEPPSSRDSQVLTAWMAEWRPRLDAKRAAAAAPAPQSAPAQSADEEPNAFDVVTGNAGPKWLLSPLAPQVKSLIDQLNEAGRKFNPPSDDADDAALEGWIASKRGLLNQQPKRSA